MRDQVLIFLPIYVISFLLSFKSLLSEIARSDLIKTVQNLIN